MFANTPTTFKAKTKEVNTCWEWLGPKDKDGYGKTTLKSKHKGAHRVAYELYVGNIPKGLTLDHLCKNRACVNPEHLEPVTSKENILRGEGISAQNARKKTCLRNHKFDKANTSINVRGERVCIACRKIREKKYVRTS